MNIKFIGKTKITKQGQVTLPFEARTDLEIDTDTDVYWYEVDDYLVVMKDLVNFNDLENILKKNIKKKR
jgi:bifunctional DNA-binding transcriptional regulator/antitoxin component of YhaV-PrlF toxin-antitoxin module